MSKIFEALKQAELERAKQREAQSSATDIFGQFERRKTRRIKVSIPLFVYGHTAKGDPFCEEVHTMEINAQGALISMETAVQPGQKLLVTNKTNQKVHTCTILSVIARLGLAQEVALEFVGPAPQFWREPTRKRAASKDSSRNE